MILVIFLVSISIEKVSDNHVVACHLSPDKEKTCCAMPRATDRMIQGLKCAVDRFGQQKRLFCMNVATRLYRAKFIPTASKGFLFSWLIQPGMSSDFVNSLFQNTGPPESIGFGPAVICYYYYREYRLEISYDRNCDVIYCKYRQR